MYCNYNAHCVDYFTVANNDVVLNINMTHSDLRYTFLLVKQVIN